MMSSDVQMGCVSQKSIGLIVVLIVWIIPTKLTQLTKERLTAFLITCSTVMNIFVHLIVGRVAMVRFSSRSTLSF